MNRIVKSSKTVNIKMKTSMIREYKMWSRSTESVFGKYKDKKYFMLR